MFAHFAFFLVLAARIESFIVDPCESALLIFCSNPTVSVTFSFGFSFFFSSHFLLPSGEGTTKIPGGLRPPAPNICPGQAGDEVLLPLFSCFPCFAVGHQLLSYVNCLLPFRCYHRRRRRRRRCRACCCVSCLLLCARCCRFRWPPRPRLPGPPSPPSLVARSHLQPRHPPTHTSESASQQNNRPACFPPTTACLVAVQHRVREPNLCMGLDGHWQAELADTAEEALIRRGDTN